ncbi:hypothetical protein N9L75_07345 [Porticoccaceae bacterium]|nr:hypothetical protein [Porticoccaceae bacterium]MDB2664432.1 hypothetical protein [Porticoccaceae bacterium]
MSVFIISLGSDKAVIFNGETVCTYDPQCDDAGCLEMLEQVAFSLSSIHKTQVERNTIEPKADDWSWDEIIEQNNLRNSSENRVSVLLNHFDEGGNAVDSSTMELSESNISDIIDHAAQLVLVMRDMANKKAGIDVFDQVCVELESALVASDVVAKEFPDANFVPALKGYLTEGQDSIEFPSESLVDAETVLSQEHVFSRSEKTSPCTSNVLADFIIQDWHVTQVGDGWIGPKEHRDAYRFVIEQSPSTNQVYFRIYPKVMDELSDELTLNGLAGCIEIRNGKPAISLGTNENDLPVHVESDIIEGLHIHCDSGSEPAREQFKSFDHGISFDSHYYRCNDSSWLMEVRSDIANERFGYYDFGELLVVDDNGWEVEDAHWSKTVFFENPAGGDSIKGHYELHFANDSIVVLSESSG